MILSTLARPFKSFFESGTAFSEKIVPRGLQKIGVSQRVASRIGLALGCAAGVASVATGLCFLAGIPLSVPMFLLSPSYFGVKGIVAACAATGLLGGVGTVVTTTGLGMCRGAARSTRTLILPPAPEKSTFNASMSAQKAFRSASEGLQKASSAPSAPVQVQFFKQFN